MLQGRQRPTGNMNQFLVNVFRYSGQPEDLNGKRAMLLLPPDYSSMYQTMGTFSANENLQVSLDPIITVTPRPNLPVDWDTYPDPPLLPSQASQLSALTRTGSSDSNGSVESRVS